MEGRAFRRRFEAKGRPAPFLEPIPTCVVTLPPPAFPGLAATLREPALA